MLHAEKGEGLVDLVMSDDVTWMWFELTWSWSGLPGCLALAAHACTSACTIESTFRPALSALLQFARTKQKALPENE